MSLPDVFCEIVAGHAPATVVRYFHDAWAIVPKNPLVAGHLVVISLEHADTAAEDPRLGGLTVQRALELIANHDWPGREGAQGFFVGHNIGGEELGIEHGQTIRHPHAQLIPRRPGDGLLLPWTVQQGGAEVREEWAYPVVRRDGGTRWVETWVREPVIPGMARRTVITTPWKAVETGSQQS